MPRKKLDKQMPCLESDFQDILVCRNPKLRPYLETFVQEAENITQENLGTLLGVLEVTDNSEDSSYIVNYLISVIKKEYFSHPKRDAVESFEAAMRKANLALSKLAEHDNLNWIGHLNAICAVIEKDNIHFSPTGTVRALLIRSKTLTDISEGGEGSGEPNPIKTFVDVLSGHLESGDKLIITTRNIFDVFSLDEIKRSALKFSHENFIQFLNTALINELEKAAVLVVNTAEKKELPAPLVLQKSANVSAFSQKAFERSTAENPVSDEERKKMIQELKEELQKTQGEFIDKKTGHIYIKDAGEPKEKFSWLNYLKVAIVPPANWPVNFWKWVKTKKINLAPLAIIVLESIKKVPLKKIFISLKNNSKLLIEKIKNKRIVARETSSSSYSNAPLNHLLKKQALIHQINSPVNALATKAKNISANISPLTTYLETIIKNITASAVKSARSLKEFPPRFSKLKSFFSNLSYQKKLYLGLAALAILVIPFFLVKWKNKPVQEGPVLSAVSSGIFPLEQDKNLVRAENLSEIYQNSGVSRLINLNGKFFAADSVKIHSLENNLDYALPENFKNPELVFEMDDLNLIFLFKENKILSFSPRSKKFQENSISLPDQAKIGYAGSYLTYVYLFDTKSNQIYRYPRATGGFGEKTDWLKENYNLSNIKTITISDSILLSDGQNLAKLYRGKRQDFNWEKTATPISIYKLYVKPGSENLYVLDKDNARIIKLAQDGSIIAQYYNADIGMATDFAVNEESKNIYITSENGVKSFEMN